MKKFLALLMASAMLLTAAACSNKDAKDDANNNADPGTNQSGTTTPGQDDKNNTTPGDGDTTPGDTDQPDAAAPGPAACLAAAFHTHALGGGLCEKRTMDL